MEKRIESSDNQIVAFDWDNRWLKGEEYAHMLKNIEAYCEGYGMKKYPRRCHPDDIYLRPRNGFIYFMEGSSVGSEFGFPRVEHRKLFKWKKMNFTTELPKRNPIVSYIVASAVKCERFFPNSALEGPAFRMHAVVLCEPEARPYILCHVRKLENSDEPITSQLYREASPAPIKKPKKESLGSIKLGIQALLDAASELVKPMKTQAPQNDFSLAQSSVKVIETDYVSMFKCNSLHKFPQICPKVKPLFHVIRPR